MTKSALAIAALLAGLSLGACTSDNESIGLSVSTICAPTDACTFQAKCDAQYIGEIVFDVAAARRQTLFVQVNNALPNNADLANGRLNTNDAHLTSFELTYSGFALASSLDLVDYSVPANGTAVVGLDLVPVQTLALTGPAAGGYSQAVAQVVAKGHLDDGSSFETGKFPVAFTVCNGCLAAAYACTGTDVFELTCGTVGTAPFRGSCKPAP
jgi:hypothetical protein